MTLFMDVHDEVPQGTDAEAVAKAHKADLAIQDKYQTRYINYWFDEKQGKIFCLVEARDPASAHAVHREAHGLVSDEIHEVVQG